ncbi:BolA family transcriptional regulator [Candidatus Pelagibacter bacterium]|jgi:BolA protein|nr:BolA family transcriptional regulator [Candidatus Pelagibacter bacterium]
MDINDLIAIVKKKLTDQIDIERIEIEDKSFLHKNHAGNQGGRYHLKIIMSSSELKSLSRIESNKRVYKILDIEMKEYIHSIQILIS